MTNVASNRQTLRDSLVSGEYSQANEVLRRGDQVEGHKYCCLGVACDIYHKDTGQGEWNEDNEFVLSGGNKVGGADYSNRENGKFDTYPPQEVADYFGFGVKEIRKMINMNDGCLGSLGSMRSFEFIAGWVEGLDGEEG